MILFHEIYVFLYLCWIGLFGAKWALLQLENYDLEEVYILKTKSVHTEKKIC
jgi:hypothetical protein